MIEITFTQNVSVGAGCANEPLQQYVHALLARQTALDLLESIHGQINQAWMTMRRLLARVGLPAEAGKAVRVARAAQAALAEDTYRALEKRREECIAALNAAERRAHAAWQEMLASSPKPLTQKNTGFSAPSRSRNTRPAWRSPRRRKSSGCKVASASLQLA